MNQGNTKHGKSKSLTYSRWKSMRQRCMDEAHESYQRYGGAGVKVCERWNDFLIFLEDMGECPSKEMTLDRINNEKGYEPGNCRWISKANQNKNRSHCLMLTYGGETKTATDWAYEIGIKPDTLIKRIRLGWSTERAITQKKKKRDGK